MRKMIVWILVFCLAISMAACHINLSGASGERDNDSEKQTEREDTDEKQTEQDSEKSTGGKKEATLPDSGLFPWGKPDYPEDPFLWITPETTLGELLAVLGEPTEYDNGNLTRPKYEGYVLYGQSVEFWFEFNADRTIRQAAYFYSYPSRLSYYDSDHYQPSAAEKENLQSYLSTITDHYLQYYGEPEDRSLAEELGTDIVWDLSTEIYEIYLYVIVDAESVHPLEVGYQVREK